MGGNLGRNMIDEPIDKPEKFEEFKNQGGERPVRKMVATSEEMDRARLHRENRDYCAHHFMAYKKCQREWFPSWWHCEHIRHDFQHCTVEDQVIRMKEYERVRRLMRREREKQAAA